MNAMIQSTYVVRQRRSRDAVLPAADGVWRLTTEAEWIVEGDAAELTEIAAALPEFAERLGDRLVLLAFRNSVGRYQVPHLGTLELRSGKWGAEHFDAMLREITEVAAALPFSAREGSGLPYERTHQPDTPVPYHAFVYLRHILSATAPAADRLEPALRRIITQPHQRMVARGRVVPLVEARNVTARGLLRVLESPWTWTPAAPTGALAIALRGHLPERVEEDQRRHTHDTAENRFVLAFLKLASEIVERMRQAALRWSSPALRGRVTQDCEHMRQIIDHARRSPLWEEVGPMIHFPASSTVLQRRHGYREVLRHYVRLRMVSRIPLSNDALQDLLALKDIAALYEIWAFFAVVRALERTLGKPAQAAAPKLKDEIELTVPWDLRVAWSDGTEAFYNPRFSRSRPAARQSTSVPLRPDIAVNVASGPNRGLHLFDAKFKLQSLAGLGDEDTDAATFKRADLYKMHTYRDAIAEARSVRILYPGDREAFYPARPQGEGPGCDGVGALPLKPGDAAAIESALSRLLSGY